MGWAGGFTNAEAAASLFASAGVPSVVRRFNDTGQLVSVRLEHVWATAFVDYTPSGGAVNQQGDSWIELDPSFKQNDYTVRRNFTSIVPVNPQDFAAQLLDGATVDSTIGSITSMNTAALRSNFDQTVSGIRGAQAALPPDQIVTELIGRRTIRQVVHAVLPAGLPYRRLVSGPSFSEVPNGLRHSVSVTLDIEVHSRNPRAAYDAE